MIRATRPLPAYAFRTKGQFYTADVFNDVFGGVFCSACHEEAFLRVRLLPAATVRCEKLVCSGCGVDTKWLPLHGWVEKTPGTTGS